VDLRDPLEPGLVREIRQALLRHGVVFFHDQELTREQMRAFVANFGTPIPEPFQAGDRPERSAKQTSDRPGARPRCGIPTPPSSPSRRA
jgi:alpha-ketoglutarate-dependent taurine dioxygenase